MVAQFEPNQKDSRGMRRIRVIGPRNLRAPVRPQEQVISTCVSSNRATSDWRVGLSPFVLGPVRLFGMGTAKVMENAWQFSKVYATHADADGNPTAEYFSWAQAGFGDGRAHRYPMGKGAVPLYSLWGTERMNYIRARREIYFPLYRDAVRETPAFRSLCAAADSGSSIALFDFDGYDHDSIGHTLADVLNDPTRKMGHALVLKMMLLHGEGVTPQEIDSLYPLAINNEPAPTQTRLLP